MWSFYWAPSLVMGSELALSAPYRRGGLSFLEAMLDLLYVGITLLFFLLSFAMVKGLNHLLGVGDE